MTDGIDLVPSKILHRTTANICGISGNKPVYIITLELGDGHDYIFTQSAYDWSVTAPVHAIGCRKCNPDPKSFICWKCKQRPENSLTLNR
jgi:hypothetical protein